MSSSLYGVVTLGGKEVRRTSRSGEDFATADISTENTTYRMELTRTGELLLSKIEKRWKHADATPMEQWIVGDVEWEDDASE